MNIIRYKKNITSKKYCQWEYDEMEKILKTTKIIDTIFLLKAKKSVLGHDNCKAFKLFDDAIALSKKNKFLNEEALAYERAGIFHLGMKCTEMASLMLSQSYNRYFDWGSIDKTKQLKQLYPGIIFHKNFWRSSGSLPSIDTDTVSEVSGISFMKISVTF